MLVGISISEGGPGAACWSRPGVSDHDGGSPRESTLVPAAAASIFTPAMQRRIRRSARARVDATSRVRSTYGMLMFKEAASGGAASLPVQCGATDVNLAVYAMRARADAVRVCLINKDLSQSARVRIDTGRRFASALAMRLTASAVDARTGVMLPVVGRGWCFT